MSKQQKPSVLGRPDTPIEAIDEDLFKVRKYIDGLAKFIRQCDTPMTISIQGDWGTGKTSMMNMIRSQLGDSVIPIWFNTWQYSQFNMDDALAISMLQTLISELGLDEGSKRSFLRKVKQVGKGVAKVGLTAIGTAAGGEAAGAAAGELVDGADGSFEFAQAIASLKEDFNDAVEKSIELAPHADRVVVFIDDLDRLHPERAVELLEVLKIFLDCPQCVFVLAVDYEVVVTGIHQKFGGELGDEKGKSFFDKIIQLPFKMPVAQYDIDAYVREMLEASGIKVPQDSDELEKYTGLIRSSVGYNPRSMKRLFNTYQLLDIVTEDVDVEPNQKHRILFAILCMQTRFEKLYAYLAETRHLDSADIEALVRPPESSADSDDDPLASIVLEGRPYDEMTGNDMSELRSMRKFMKKFFDALQMDDDDSSLSQEELEALKALLRDSTVTSTNVEQQDFDDEEIQRLRYWNIMMCREAKNKARRKGVKTDVRERRRARDGSLSTETVIHHPIGHKINGEYELSVKREPNPNRIDVRFRLKSTKRDEPKLRDLFEDDPLGYGPGTWEEGYLVPFSSKPTDNPERVGVNQAAEELSEIIRHVAKAIEERLAMDGDGVIGE